MYNDINNHQNINKRVKISIILIKLCEFKNVELNLAVVYGFRKVPMMITNLKGTDKRICTAVYVYLIMLRIDEYFKFKEKSFYFENLMVQPLMPIINLNLLFE